MNGLEEIQKIIKNFVNESKQVKKQISEIESKRTQLAQERNEKKNANTSDCGAEISVLGKQISELGNQSQELQNKLDLKFNEMKRLVNLTIDNLITEGIRKVRKIDEERQELEDKILLQEERDTKYEMQKQEFYERFGRMPELSEKAKKEDEIQDKQCLTYQAGIKELEDLIVDMEVELAELATVKRNFKNKNWSNIIGSENLEEEAIVLPLMEEEIQIEELEPIEYVKVEDFEPIEEIEIEEFEPIEKIEIEEFEPIEKIEVEEIEPIEKVEIEELNVEPFDIEEIEEQETTKNSESIEIVEEFEEHEPIVNVEQAEKIEPVIEQKQVDEVEELAKAIVEEIIAEQTKDLNMDKVEEKQEIKQAEEQTETVEQEIITFEEKEKEENVNTPVFEEKVTLSNIIAKIEDGEIVYKVQVSNGEEFKVYPTLETRNILLNDKECREEIKEILINYAVAEYRLLDNKVINKIDPTVCEVLERFANKYNYDARYLIYNYAMSFSKNGENEIDIAIPITYNFSYLKGTNLSKKEKKVISKICKNALKNEKVDIIGSVTGFSRIKYVFKRLFAANNANALPEGKY